MHAKASIDLESQMKPRKTPPLAPYVASISALVFVLVSGTTFAAALGPGPYVGFGLGQSTMNDAGTALLGVPTDDTDTAVKFFGGIMFSPYVGLELGSIDFGTFRGSSPRENWQASGVNFSFVGALPLQDSAVSLFGKVGANSWTVGDDLISFGTVSTSGTSLSYGFGTEIALSRNLGANLQWERFTDVGDPNITGRSDIDLLTVNLVYHFRPVGYRYPYGGRRRY
jgi:OmpA-OmpF porin, OOP family